MARFLPKDFFDTLPENPELAWAEAVDHGVKYLGEVIDQHSRVEDDELARIEVLDFIHDLQKTLGIRAELGSGNVEERLQKARAEATRLRGKSSVARIAERYASSTAQDAPGLVSPKTRIEIVRLVRDLKSAVTNSDLDEKQKGRLLKRLDAFEQDVVAGRRSFKDTIVAISFIGAAIAGTASTLADAPEAWETLGRISGLIGIEAKHEEELRLLTKSKEPLPLASPDDHKDVSEGTSQ